MCIRDSADTVLEASVGTGDAQARYAGRGMDGSQFERTNYGLRFEKKDFEGLLNELKANVYYNDVDHVMDNYTPVSYTHLDVYKRQQRGDHCHQGRGRSGQCRHQGQGDGLRAGR